MSFVYGLRGRGSGSGIPSGSGDREGGGWEVESGFRGADSLAGFSGLALESTATEWAALSTSTAATATSSTTTATATATATDTVTDTTNANATVSETLPQPPIPLGYDASTDDVDEDSLSLPRTSISTNSTPIQSSLQENISHSPNDYYSKQPVITKSRQLSHIQSIFNDSQKIAYVGLCYLLIHKLRSRYEAYCSASNASYSKTPNVKAALSAFNEWAEKFMRMLYAFVDVSEQEQTMIINLATHGLVPTDLSKSLLDDAARALEQLQKMQAEEAWIKKQEEKYMGSASANQSNEASPVVPSTNPAVSGRTSLDGSIASSSPPTAADVSDIRYTILSHLFILCICDGLYDTRSRTLLREVAQELNISWWELARLEDTIGEQLRRQDSGESDIHGASSVQPEEKILKERNAKDSRGRWLYMGLATLAGGAVIGVTAGLAAPLIASGITAAMTTFHVAGGAAAGVAAAMGGTTGIAIIASSGASIGGGLTGYKMHKRTKGILEFEFIGLGEAMESILANKAKRDERSRKKKAKAVAAAAAEERERELAKEREKQNEGWLGGESTVEKQISPISATNPVLITLANETRDPQGVVPAVNPVAIKPRPSFAQHDRRGSTATSIGSDRVSRDHRSDSVVAPPILFSEGPEGEGEEPGSTRPPKANVLITIAGWVGSIDSRDDFTLPFSTLTPDLHGDQYALVWETQALIELGHAVRLLMSEVTSFVVQQGIQYFLLPVLMAGLTGPMWALKLTYMVDNPWGNGLTKARKAGRLLADTLLSRVQGNRPVTLVGFSLGARVIYYCLLELASRGEAAYSLVEEAYMFGTPVMATQKEWRQIAGVVSGRIVNGYMTNDWVLSILYRASSALFSDVAGLNPVKGVDGIENVCLDGLLKGGHLEYRAAMPRILKHVGFSVDEEMFDDGEKEAEQARLDAEKEKERLKSEKERANEEAARKKQAELEERQRKAKMEAEAKQVAAAAAAAAAKQTTTKRSWFGSSSSSKASSKEVLDELPFEIKEKKSTLPPLVLSLNDNASSGGKGGSNVSDVPFLNSDGSLI